MSRSSSQPRDIPRSRRAIRGRDFGQGRLAGKPRPRAGLYARVSTHDQQTLPMQMRAMKAYVAQRGWSIALQVEDVGSGASERPKRELLLDAARRQKIDAILVWRLDRWGRSLPDLVVTLHELAALEVGFISLTEALDLTTPTTRTPAACSSSSPAPLLRCGRTDVTDSEVLAALRG